MFSRKWKSQQEKNFSRIKKRKNMKKRKIEVTLCIERLAK